MLNKKGAEAGVLIIVLIIIAVVVVILAILFFSTSFGKIRAAVGLTDAQAGILENVCEGALASGTKATWCYTFHQVEENRIYSNCEEPKVFDKFKGDQYKDQLSEVQPCGTVESITNGLFDKCDIVKDNVATTDLINVVLYEGNTKYTCEEVLAAGFTARPRST